jgi:hypothetical protein
LDKYKFNQAAFIEGEKRFVLRAGEWLYAPVGNNGKEPIFEGVEKGFQPLEELNLGTQRKKYLGEAINSFNLFSDKVMDRRN